MDLKPLLRPYFGADLSVFHCPLINDQQNFAITTNDVGCSYMLFFDCIGSQPQPSHDIGGLGPRRGQVDAYGNLYVGYQTTNSVTVTQNYVESGGLMLKLGDSWFYGRSNFNLWFNLLGGDLFKVSRYVNHNDLCPDYEYLGIQWLSGAVKTYAWGCTNGLLPAGSGNLLGTDGSVRNYRIPANLTPWSSAPANPATAYATNKFIRLAASGLIIPIDYSVQN